MNRQAHILVVEDDRDIRDSVVEVLEDAGYTVVSAGDGQAALSALGAGPRPDLILLDLMMPVMNGFEFRAAQLADRHYATIPIAVLTADADAKLKAQRLRAAGCVRKPIKIQPLLDLVQSVLDSV